LFDFNFIFFDPQASTGIRKGEGGAHMKWKSQASIVHTGEVEPIGFDVHERRHSYDKHGRRGGAVGLTPSQVR
jgi:hypothetical protein